jgi:DNA-binding MarR family transcriptional regulator
MESSGWITRKPHESDRRAYRIRVTRAGKSKFTQLRDIAIELQTAVLTSLPENDREQFLENLSRLADACRNAAELPAKDDGE